MTYANPKIKELQQLGSEIRQLELEIARTIEMTTRLAEIEIEAHIKRKKAQKLLRELWGQQR